MRRIAILLITAFFLQLTGCSPKDHVMDGDGMVRSYSQISQEEAKQMMEKDDGHIIVDVRRQDEYDAGHIPGAILIPNESIGAERLREKGLKAELSCSYSIRWFSKHLEYADVLEDPEKERQKAEMLAGPARGLRRQ